MVVIHNFYMRKLLLLFMLVVSDLYVSAGIATTDCISVNDVTVVPGSDDEYELLISLDGSQIYTAYEMDIQFPAGLDVVMEDGYPIVDICNDDKVYPLVQRKTDHTITSSYNVIGKGILRLSCVSLKNLDLAKEKGKLLSVICKAGPYLKPGNVELKVTNLHLISKTSGEVLQYDCSDQTLTVNVESKSTASITVSPNNKWGSCVLPVGVSPLPSGLQAYSVVERSDDGYYAILNEETEIKPYTPYLLYDENGFSGSFSGDVDASKYAEVVKEGILYGAVVPQTVEDGFVLQNQGDGVKLYSMYGTEFNIPAGRCWVVPEENNGPKVMELTFGDTNAVPGVKLSTDEFQRNADVVYSLSGQRIAVPMTGNIYIVNGHKVLWLK